MSDDVMGRISSLEKSCRNSKMLGFALIAVDVKTQMSPTWEFL